ncbi:restriction endonuclease subunit S [Shewanella frigidimarina]|nr:restriction endonuclease subunit S [Shewanella frigidimarina]
MSALEQAVPDGFWQSDIGILPTDWKINPLAEISVKITDGTHDTPKPIKEGIPFLTAIHVKENHIAFESCYFLPKSIHDEIYKRCNPEYEDILMVNIGAGTGTTALVNVKYPFSLKNVALIKPNRKVSDGRFLNQILSFLKDQILESLSAGGAQPFLSLSQIGQINVPTPCKREQTAIADALSDVDALLNEIEKLIAKKQAIKTATMQQLLTGKTRLPQFAFHPEVADITAQHNQALSEDSATAIATGSNSNSKTNTSASATIIDRNNSTLAANNKSLESRRKGTKHSELGEIPEDWEVVELSSITQKQRPISYGIVQTGPRVNDGVRCLRVVDISNGLISKDDLITTTVEISNSYKRTQLQLNDLVIPLRGKVGEVGIIDVDLVGDNLTRGVALIALKNGFSAKFIKQIITFENSAKRLESSMNGSALQEVSIATLRSFKVAIPLEKEQTAISTVLSDMDEEIQALQQRLNKTRQIKQGMMQELLTGKTRLPFEKVSISEASV